MNKNLLEQLKDFSLNRDEKKQAKDDIIQHMEDNPVRIDDESRHILQKQSGLVGLFNSLLTNKTMTGTIVAAAMVLFGGGTSFAAEGSLPGDTLYPVKTNVNEEVVSMVKVSNKSQAKWDIRRSERRLEEIEDLAADGEIGEEAKEEVQTRLKSHIKEVKDRVKKMEEGGDTESSYEVASGLETSLKAHQNILEKMHAKVEAESKLEAEESKAGKKSQSNESEEEEKSEEKRGLGSIISTLALESKSASEIKSKIQEKISNRDKSKGKDKQSEKEKENEEESESSSKEGISQVKAAAEGKLKAAANKIDSVKRFISKKESQLSLSTKEEVNSKLEDAKETFAKGKAELEAENYGQAFIKFQEAHELSKTSKILVASGINAKLENNNKDKEVPEEAKNKKKNDNDKEKQENRKKGAEKTKEAQEQQKNNEQEAEDREKENKVKAEETRVELKLKGEARQGGEGAEVNLNAKSKSKVEAGIAR